MRALKVAPRTVIGERLRRLGLTRPEHTTHLAASWALRHGMSAYLRLTRAVAAAIGAGSATTALAAMTGREVYSIAIFGGRSLVDLKPLEDAENPVVTCAQVTDTRGRASSKSAPMIAEHPQATDTNQPPSSGLIRTLRRGQSREGRRLPAAR